MRQFTITLFITLLIILCSAFTRGIRTGGSGSDMTEQVSTAVIDNSVVQVFYQLRRVYDSLIPDKRVEQSTMILQIGESGISKFFTDNRVRDSINRVRAATAQSVEVAGRIVGAAVSSFNPRSAEIVFKNWPKGSITVTDLVGMRHDLYSYTEPSPEIEWQILPDIETILSYSCQKAVTTFRGRNYEAWFAPDIPINEGPWKFCGLPGLVLKVSDTRQHYIFECVGLEQVKAPIEYSNLGYIKTTREELAIFKQREAEDPYAFSGMAAPTLINGVNYSQLYPNLNPPYNPIEL